MFVWHDYEGLEAGNLTVVIGMDGLRLLAMVLGVADGL